MRREEVSVSLSFDFWCKVVEYTLRAHLVILVILTLLIYTKFWSHKLSLKVSSVLIGFSSVIFSMWNDAVASGRRRMRSLTMRGTLNGWMSVWMACLRNGLTRSARPQWRTRKVQISNQINAFLGNKTVAHKRLITIFFIMETDK